MILTKQSIAAYTRISVDVESDKDHNTSIENQKAIIKQYISKHFPDSDVEFFEDRDRSGYTFAEREDYQRMRSRLVSGEFNILIVKDFSRFSRRNGRGLVELEDLRDAGVRIISINDGIDYPNDDNWTRIQIQFFVNEMPVTDASRKVRSVVRSRQEEGRWICAVPFGYAMIDTKRMTYGIVETEAEIVREVFKLYVEQGMGYRRIANYLTEKCIPTPRALEKARREAAGREYNGKIKDKWSHVTIEGMLRNDFYIGTLRQHKYARKTIKGKDQKVAAEDEIVHENAHQPIIDTTTFLAAQSLLERRSTSHYRGQKKNANMYSGFLFCGDCGERLSTLSKGDDGEAYSCSTYNKKGKKYCTNHYVKAVDLDQMVKNYLEMIHSTCRDMIAELQAAILREGDDTQKQEDTVDTLQKQIEKARRKIQTYLSMKAEARIEGGMFVDELIKNYDAVIAEESNRILGLESQIQMAMDRRNNIIRVNRTAKAVIDILQSIIEKPRLDRQDLELLIDKIVIFQDKEVEEGRTSGYKHIEIHLKADVDAILHSGVLPGMVTEDTENFTFDIVDSLKTQLVRKVPKHQDEVYNINVVSKGDPLEIYTEKDGGVIFRKYSPMGDLQDFAAQICESIGANTGHVAAVADRDSIIALHGAPKRELVDKPNSQELDRLMQSRKNYRYMPGEALLKVSESSEKYHLGVAAPILSQGDLMGCVMLLLDEKGRTMAESDQRLAQTVAGFLGKQMES